MRLDATLAWRNVWRNPRRTGLTVAATVFAVVLVVFSVAMAAGVHEKMIEDGVRVNSGHVVISGEGYLENRTLEEFVRFDRDLVQLLDAGEGIAGYAPRVVSFGLVSRDSTSHGVAVLGVDPEREGSVTTLPERVRQGRFVAAGGSREIVLGERLAANLSARIGDELLLYSVAYSLETAYELFRLVGILKLPDAELERLLAVVSLDAAQEFFVYGDRVSEVAILARDADRVPAVAEGLRRALGAEAGSRAEPVEVYTWRESMPELVQFIVLDDAGMYILLVILIVVVAFGIFNTILMAVLERQREFGVLLALGLRPAVVFRIVYLESLMLASVGLALGLLLAIPLVLYLEAHPIPLTGDLVEAMELFGIEPVMTWKLKPLNPLGSALTLFGVAVAAALYPAIKASRGRPVDVLRGL